MISLCYPYSLPTIFVNCEHFSEVPTILLAVWPPLPLGIASVFSCFHYPPHDKSLSILILPYTFLFLLMGKTLGLFLPISLVCIKWSQLVYYLFWVRTPPQYSTSQKRSWLDTWNRTFSHLHQITPSVIPLTMGPPPLPGWVQVGGASAIIWLSYCFMPHLLSFARNFYHSYLILSSFVICWDWGSPHVVALYGKRCGLVELALSYLFLYLWTF